MTRRTTSRFLTAVVLSAALTAGACSEDDDGAQGDASGTSTSDPGSTTIKSSSASTSSPTDAPATTAGGPSGTAAGAGTDGPGTTASGRPTTSTTAAGTTTTTAPMGRSVSGRLVLDRTCVTKGSAQELQGITLDTGKEGETVIYSTGYSDGSSEMGNPQYATGFGSGPSGQDGRFRRQWVVPPTAPEGRATILAVHTRGDDHVQDEAAFLIADKC